MSPESDMSARKPVGGDPSLSLVKQAEGLGRAVVMKDVVGPVLAELMEPVYDTNLSPSERSDLPSIQAYADLTDFSATLKGMLIDRFESLRLQNIDAMYQYNEVREMRYNRRDSFSIMTTICS